MVLGGSHSIASTLVPLLNRGNEQHWPTVIEKGQLVAECESDSTASSLCPLMAGAFAYYNKEDHALSASTNL